MGTGTWTGRGREDGEGQRRMAGLYATASVWKSIEVERREGRTVEMVGVIKMLGKLGGVMNRVHCLISPRWQTIKLAHLLPFPLHSHSYSATVLLCGSSLRIEQYRFVGRSTKPVESHVDTC